MPEKTKTLFARYHEPIMYLIFGVLTTIVNYAAYFILSRLSGWETTSPATAAAWIISVAFAYATNRKWVFASAASGAAIFKEMLAFTGSRLFSGLVDIAVMYVAVDVMKYPDWIIKLLSNVLVVILNYALSKLLVFRKTGIG